MLLPLPSTCYNMFSIEMINPNTLPTWIMCSDYHYLVRVAGVEPTLKFSIVSKTLKSLYFFDLRFTCGT